MTVTHRKRLRVDERREVEVNRISFALGVVEKKLKRKKKVKCRTAHWLEGKKLKSENFIFTASYPLTARVVGAPQMTSQPVSSMFPCSPLSSGTWRTPGLSIRWCLPISSYVCLVFFPLSLCFARCFWPDLMNGRHWKKKNKERERERERELFLYVWVHTKNVHHYKRRKSTQTLNFKHNTSRWRAYGNVRRSELKLIITKTVAHYRHVGISMRSRTSQKRKKKKGGTFWLRGSVLVGFSSLSRILWECTTIHSPTLHFFFYWRLAGAQ